MTLAPPFSSAEPVDEAFAAPLDAPGTVEPSLFDASAAVKDAAAELGSRVRDTVSLAQRTLRNTARDNPFLLVGSAFGGGFVAGGGLASPLTRALVGVGLRTAGAFLIDAAVQTFGQPQAAAGAPPTHPPADAHAPVPTSPPSATSEAMHHAGPPSSSSDGMQHNALPPDASFVPHV